MFSLPKTYKHIETLTGLFVAILIISNMASTKILDLGWFTFDGGTILFPLTYIFGDILTEVYGYARSRKVIWTGFASLLLMSAVFYLVQILPPAADWPNQMAFETILGLVPRIALGSLVAYFAGEFTNSYILAKMKVAMKGKWLWTRTIGSTLVGEGVDTFVFVLIAFYGTLPNNVIWILIVSNYIFKTGVEVLFTPITYVVAGWLKKVENEDFYDKKTNFNPFRLK